MFSGFLQSKIPFENNNIQNMEGISLFPETRLFRIGGQTQLNHKCGGCASIIIILALLAILAFKLMEVFSMTTIFFSSQTNVDFQPIMTTMTTYQNDPELRPYMLAFMFKSNECSTHNQSFSAQHCTYQNWKTPLQVTSCTPIVLQQCTHQHFSKIQQISTNVNSNYILSQSLCLPLNQNYQIGGNNEGSPLAKQIIFKFTCTQTCNVNNCGYITVLEQGALINPNNKDKPFAYFMHQNDFQLNNADTFTYANELEEKILETDKTILPFQSMSTQKILTSKNLRKGVEIKNSLTPQTQFSLRRSAFTESVDRSFLKLLDIASYVGGLFPTLFSIFFFMGMFGIYFYEMTFAYEHFRCQEAEDHGFWRFLKKGAYSTLTSMGCKLNNWKEEKQQLQIQRLMDKMLDINFLYKRIDYLETALSMLMTEYELKGVYLYQTKIKRTELQIKEHRFRDRLLKMLSKRVEDQNEAQLKKQNDYFIIQKDKNMLRRSTIKSYVDSLSNYKGQSEVKLRGTEGLSPRKTKRKSLVQVQDLERQRLQIERNNNISKLKHQSKKVELSEKQELKQFEIEEQLGGDLRKLFHEASKGSKISKKIVEGMDQWFISELQIAIEKYERENPRFSLIPSSCSEEGK